MCTTVIPTRVIVVETNGKPEESYFSTPIPSAPLRDPGEAIKLSSFYSTVTVEDVRIAFVDHLVDKRGSDTVLLFSKDSLHHTGTNLPAGSN